MSDYSFSNLRTQLDGSDKFVAGGHGEIQTAGATRHAERMRRVPVWAEDNHKMIDFLTVAFPKWKIDPKQKDAAMLWMKIIRLYWRAGMTTAQVAYETGKTVKQIENYLWSINKVASGKNSMGRDRLRKRGRPRKNNQGIEPTSGSNGTDSHHIP